ncbi:uncharacterized protein CXorf65 homolog isoform X1 [Petromyzon marinus]|uniref:Uncharacterized protein C22orf15 homolog isoform X1 n=1 Tax=Petromyzon marinus TaxID=7757 RepID=A0AAJ7X427_PETMA|nr:uncharacterized protein C22orf15 homolog isoform X1 [Petromyzon marinus]
MFVIVKYGERQQALFNPSCQARLLLRSIRIKLGCDPDAELELCDEMGQLKHVSAWPERLASELLAERETLVAVRVFREGDQLTYRPLLDDPDIVNPKFIARLSSRDNYRPMTSARNKIKKVTKKNPANFSTSSFDGPPKSVGCSNGKLATVRSRSRQSKN